MRKINNQACLDRLSYRILAARKKKNLAAIAAILLTTIMFTVLFTISSGMIESFQKTTMRQVGSSSMAELKDILPEQYELFAKDREVKNPSYRIFVGNAVNNVLLKMNTEIYYATEESAKAMFCLPEHGTMPKERMDIAVSTRILDTLKLPHRIGETVRLQISVNGEILEGGIYTVRLLGRGQGCYGTDVFSVQRILRQHSANAESAIERKQRKL